MKFNRVETKILHTTKKKLKRIARRYAKKTFGKDARFRVVEMYSSSAKYDAYNDIRKRKALVIMHINWADSKEGAPFWMEVYDKIQDVHRGIKR